jgi:hypothetical protein
LIPKQANLTNKQPQTTEALQKVTRTHYNKIIEINTLILGGKMKNTYSFLSILFLLIYMTNFVTEATGIKLKTVWCFHPNGGRKKTCFEISEKDLKAAIDRLENLYKRHKKAFVELQSKCTDPNYPLSTETLETLQNNHIANINGEIYTSYQELVPLVFKVIKVNPPQTKFIQFKELVSTGAITKKTDVTNP